MTESPIDQLVQLSRALGEPARELAILAEGNTSARTGPGRLAVKASGTSLDRAASGDFVELDATSVLAAIDDPALEDGELGAALTRARTAGGPRPSIEGALHAICVEEAGAAFVGHTHPVPVNQILCSDRAPVIVEPLFPDQVVVCGRHPLLVPYASPGLPLARAVRDRLGAHVARHGAPPSVIYLINHGLIALGATAAEVLQVTEMAVKAARVLAGALAVGEPRPLDPAEADQLEARQDEHHRRRMLAGRSLG